MAIDWEVVAQKGAESLTTAFATQFGGAAGKALAAAIFGGQDDAFQNEVMGALRQIEAKLDTIISFLYSNLPELIKQQVRSEIVANNIRALHGQAVVTDGAIAVFNARGPNPTAEHLQAITAVGDESFKLGINVLGSGMEWYLAGLHAFATGVSAYACAIKHDKAYARGLAKIAGEYSRLTSPMVQMGSGDFSYKDKLARMESALAEAQMIMSYFPPGTSTDFLLSWERVQNALGTGPVVMAYGGWWGIQPNGALWGNYLVDIFAVPYAAFNPATDLVKSRFKIAPWWTPVESPFSKAHYDALGAKVGASMSYVVNLPPKISMLKQTVPTIEAFVEAMNCFASYEPEERDLKQAVSGVGGRLIAGVAVSSTL